MWLYPKDNINSGSCIPYTKDMQNTQLCSHMHDNQTSGRGSSQTQYIYNHDDRCVCIIGTLLEGIITLKKLSCDPRKGLVTKMLTHQTTHCITQKVSSGRCSQHLRTRFNVGGF